MTLRKILSVFVVLCTVAVGASAAVRISDYDATVRPQKDGWTEISERLTVTADAETEWALERTISRNRRDGLASVPSDLALASVTCGENLQKAKLTSVGEGSWRISTPPVKFGDEKKQVWTLRYRVAGAVFPHDGAERLSWNVTSNKWSVPIDRVSATVIMPDEQVHLLGFAAATGNAKERGKDFRSEQDGDRSVKFQTLSGLPAGDALALSVDMTPCVFARAGGAEETGPSAAELASHTAQEAQKPAMKVIQPAVATQSTNPAQHAQPTQPAKQVFSNSRDRIMDYDVTVQVDRDGISQVTEKIKVWVSGLDQIKRGIDRVIPTLRLAPDHTEFSSDLKMKSISLDGQPVPWKSKDGKDEVVLYRVGDPDKYLSRGEHTFKFVYLVKRQVVSFKGYDELYWNATGNYWKFPIEKARARLALPQGAIIEAADYWTGATKSKEKNASSQKVDDRTWTFETTRPLDVQEGLTVAVKFNQGVVINKETVFVRFGLNNMMILTGIISAFLALLAWFIFGRDPRPGVIIPLFHAPEGVSAAVAERLFCGRMEGHIVGTAILSLATKGQITIEGNKKDGYVLNEAGEDVKKKYQNRPLTGDEKDFLAKLDLPVTLRKNTSDSSVIYGAYQELALDTEVALSDCAEDNMLIRIGLVLLTFVLVGVGCWLASPGGTEWILAVFMYAFGCVFISGVACGIRRSCQIPGGWLRRLLKGGFRLLFISLFIGVVLSGLFGYIADVPEALRPGMTVLAVMPYIIVWAVGFLGRLTPEGRQLKDQLLGLKKYICLAEKERMKLIDPPDKTPEHFEELLPYALALGVEHQWAESFAEIFKKLQAENQWTPSWYEGEGLAFAASSFCSDISSSMSDVISSEVAREMRAAAASGSGGGFGGGGCGGGGCSGGGGGGGGGGGW